MQSSLGVQTYGSSCKLEPHVPDLLSSNGLLFPSKVPSYEEGALLLVPVQEDLALLPTTLCTSAVPLLLCAVDSLAIHSLGNIQLPLPSTLSSIDLFITQVLNANQHP